MTVGKRMIILMFTQTRILTLRRRGTIMIPFRFPIRYGHIRNEAKEKASQNYQKFHRNLSEKGLQISENHVTIELNDTSCITKGTLRVIERAVEAQPCEMQKVSDGKETMVDEQQ